MTIRQLYDNVLSELNKVEAPSLLLEDFVYFANKSIQQYVNKVYNRYDINQQSTDDLRALKASIQLRVYPYLDENNELIGEDFSLLTGDKYRYVELPSDYLHLLNCIVFFKQGKNNNDNSCSSLDEKNKMYRALARRLTSDMYPNILNNAYFKPSYKTPFYFITEFSTDNLNHRSPLKLELRCGSEEKYVPNAVYIDYIRMPLIVTLNYDELEEEEDTTSMLEFPEYVCYEIVNECVKLIMENSSDPRLQTNIPINQTIGTNVSQTK